MKQVASRLWVASSIALGCLTPLTPATAQIVPDNTLPVNSSVTPGCTVCMIEGGTTRGVNLFHSFREFSVPTGGEAFFNNASQIETIFSRVTGKEVSNIDGLLRANGTASLFFLNPNGILFGAGARLDIGGSFVATTANSFKFADGSEFSATNPTAPPLLTVNVTPGVQWGTSSPGATITNRGNLAPQQNLTLVADKLDLQGQLEAGGDLTLLAQDAVKVRDSLTTPFLALSGGNLTVEGKGGIDILALNHPTQTPFVSGGNLSLISDGVISGDARFRSGDSFSIKSVSGGLANFVSYYDPIISSTGDVDVAANYTGTSLLVEAMGNIRFGGNINITGPDTSTLPEGPDTATLSSGSALIMRSGQSSLAYGGVNSGAVPAYGTGSVPEGITIGGNAIVQPFNGVGGIVTLLAASGDVSTRLISTNGQQIRNLDNDANGGAISIEAANGSINTGSLYSYSYSREGAAGNGGDISLIAANGSIHTSDLFSDSRSISGSGGSGGAINLVAANGSIHTGDLFSDSSLGSGSGRNGGAISLVAANGSIDTGYLFSISYSNFGSAGQGGAIRLEAANGINITGYLFSVSYSNFGSAGSGGTISLVAANGINITGNLSSFSYSKFGSAGQGGNISLEATSTIELLINEYDVNTQTFKRVPGGSINSTGVLGSGNISIVSNAPLTLDNSVISSDTFGSGEGGEIYISAPSISLTNGAQLSASTHSSGQGGNITLIASDSVELSGATLEVPQGIFEQAGFATIPTGTFLGGFIPTGKLPPTDDNGVPKFPPETLFPSGVFTQTTVGSTGSAGNISFETGQLIIKEGAAIATSTFGQNSNAGNISVQVVDSISLDNGSIKSGVAEGARGNSGNITVNANTLSAVNGGQLLTSTSGDGQAGDILVNAQQIQLSGSNSGLFAQTSSAAEAGNLTLQPLGEGQMLTVHFFGGAQISASTSGSGRGGNLTITAPESITLSGNGSLISAETSGSGTGGDLTLQTGMLTVRDEAKVTVSSTGTGDAGNLNISANSVLLDNGELIAQTASGEGGNINLNVSDLLSMRNNSLISAQAGNNGNGGNIDIDARLILAIPKEDSDIVADADRGNGGNINITTSGIFGLEYRNQRTPLSDITASSKFGVSGTVTINRLDVDPSRGLAALPTNVVDPSQQIARSCTQRGEQASRFVATGRGGLPLSPDEPLRGRAIVTPEWVTLDEDAQTSAKGRQVRGDEEIDADSSSPSEIVEANGWVVDSKGNVVLVAHPQITNPVSTQTLQSLCHHP